MAGEGLDIDIDITDIAAVADAREQLLAAVADHAGEIAAAVARLDGGDYGSRSFSTDRGQWTLKHERGTLQYLRYEPQGGGETYVVSTQRPAAPEPLSAALADYDAFVTAYNDYVDRVAGLLDDVDDEFPAVRSTADVAAERDRIVDGIERACHRMAEGLYRYEGTEYGTFSARVDSTRWELKRETERVSYLRVGGSNGIYLLSQYGQPSAADVRSHAPEFGGFVAAYNDHVAELAADLETIEL